LQRAGGVASFFLFHLGHRLASSALMDPITKAFIAQMEQFAKREKVSIVRFEKGQRKDDVAAEQLAHRGIGYQALDNGILSCDDPKLSGPPWIIFRQRSTTAAKSKTSSPKT
jgi:hypothetical protein